MAAHVNTVLGIESTAHTLGIGIVKGKEVLVNELDTYMPEKGILPREAAEHHAVVFEPLLKAALKKAFPNTSNSAWLDEGMKHIDAIAVAQGPGIGAPLTLGVGLAKFLSAYYSKAIVGVNHPYAHIKIAEKGTGIKHGIIVYVSGGNTQILFKEQGFYHILGETLDISVGNLFDTFARKAGIKPAHGSALAKAAKNGKYVKLPYTVKAMNLQYSGLLTAGLQKLETERLEDVAFSLMHTAFYMLAEVAERAFHLKKASGAHVEGFVLCGGVAQNKLLQDIFQKLAKENNAKFGVASSEYNRDNGAMIAYAGKLLLEKYGPHDIDKLQPLPYYRIEQMAEIIEKQKQNDKASRQRTK